MKKPILKIDLKKENEGIEFLRELILWSNNRPEYLNEKKRPSELLQEFAKSFENLEFTKI